VTEVNETRRRTFVDLTPLKVSPAFARLWFGQAISGIGAWLTLTAVSLEIFHITESTFMVALVGGISLLPMIAAGLWGGMLVDAFDRRTVAIVTAIVSWLSTAALLGLSIWDTVLSAAGGHAEVWPWYLVTTVNAVATTISMAARSAIIPRIVPEDMVSRATALNGLTFGIQLTVGPAVAGILIASVGFPITYAIDAVLFTAGFIGVFGLPRLPPLSHVDRPGLKSLVDGFRFLAKAPNIRASFIADIIAMSLGRPQVLFPALGTVAIGGGSITVGILTASMAVGTALTGLLSGPVARIHRHGVAIARSIMVFGGFTVLFGLVVLGGSLGWFGPVGDQFTADQVAWPALILAFLFLAGTGASDEVSAIFRSTMMLTAAPDEMRGRMQGIFTVVVTGGPRIGDLITGTLATLIGLWAAPVLGGIAIMALIWVLVRSTPRFRAYDARDPTP
jgi:MFS family permease